MCNLASIISSHVAHHHILMTHVGWAYDVVIQEKRPSYHCAPNSAGYPSINYIVAHILTITDNSVGNLRYNYFFRPLLKQIVAHHQIGLRLCCLGIHLLCHLRLHIVIAVNKDDKLPCCCIKTTLACFRNSFIRFMLHKPHLLLPIGVLL